MSDLTERARAINAALNGRSSEAAPEPPAEHGRVALPDVRPPKADVVGTMVRRRSSYAYRDAAVELSAISALLRFALGVQRFVSAYGDDEFPLGMAPSAGGLPSVRAYVFARRVAGLDSGLYRYDSIAHDLVKLDGPVPVHQLGSAYLEPDFAANAAATLALTARLDVAFEHYPLRHYRTVHTDTGIAAQNLYLIGTALKLSCGAISEFDDAGVSALLNLPESEIPTLLFTAGHPL